MKDTKFFLKLHWGIIDTCSCILGYKFDVLKPTEVKLKRTALASLFSGVEVPFLELLTACVTAALAPQLPLLAASLLPSGIRLPQDWQVMPGLASSGTWKFFPELFLCTGLSRRFFPSKCPPSSTFFFFFFFLAWVIDDIFTLSRWEFFKTFPYRIERILIFPSPIFFFMFRPREGKIHLLWQHSIYFRAT